MKDILIRPFQDADRHNVIAIWHACGLVHPTNNPDRDIDRKVKVRPDLFLVALRGNEIVGTIMAGYEGHRGWINYLAVRPENRCEGIARSLMGHVERVLHSEGCPKINLQVRTTNTSVLDFYKAVGYVRDDVVSLGRRLIQD